MSPFIAIALTASLSVPPAAASAPTSDGLPTRPALAAQVAALAESAASGPAATRLPPGGDSLKNGAITGAVAAGVALGGFVYYLCRALDETGGDANCFGPSLVVGGVAAAGGAAVGAGIDALFVRAPSVRMRVSF